MDPRKVYAPDRPPPVPRFTTSKALQIEPIESHPNLSAATTVLRALENGATRLVAEIEALRIDRYLQTPSETAGARRELPRASRLRERRKVLPDVQHRISPAAAAVVDNSGLLPGVATALKLLNGERPKIDRQFDYAAAIAQIENDLQIVESARLEQCEIVRRIRDELSLERARADIAQWDALRLKEFRAAQALARTRDALNEFDRSRREAGYDRRSDINRPSHLRAPLVLGSEGDWQSDISRARRELETEKVL